MVPDITTFIKTIGLVGVWAVVFAESGLLIGFFFPGDSLLFTAGFLASQGFFPPGLLIFGAFVAAVARGRTGYAFGQKIGKRIFHKEDSLYFHKDNLTKAQDFYKKHGKKTIILARFVPVVRTFAPIVAGVGDMEYKTFLTFNLIGGLLWAVGVTSLGYVLGSSIPDIDHYLLPIIALIIFLSILPSLYHLLKSPDSRAHLCKMLGLALRKIKK